VASAKPEPEPRPRIPWRWVVAAASGLLLIVALVTVPLPEVSPPTLPPTPSIFANTVEPPVSSTVDVPVGVQQPVVRRPTVAMRWRAAASRSAASSPVSGSRGGCRGCRLRVSSRSRSGLVCEGQARYRPLAPRGMAVRSGCAARSVSALPRDPGRCLEAAPIPGEDAAVILGRIFGTDARAKRAGCKGEPPPDTEARASPASRLQSASARRGPSSSSRMSRMT
jgi:hypothetical protein